jgi:hypothetical protein
MGYEKKKGQFLYEEDTCHLSEEENKYNSENVEGHIGTREDDIQWY